MVACTRYRSGGRRFVDDPPCWEDTIMRGSGHRKSLVILFGVLLCGGAGRAEAAATSDQGASILFFAKVVADGVRDTVIEITNTSNLLVTAHCIYVRGLGACSATAAPCRTDADCPAFPQPQICLDRWQTVDFNIMLTAQQPTVWPVGAGRALNPADALTGFDPGFVPPASAPFQGELKCIQTDASGAPISANALIGRATIKNTQALDLASYNAVGLRGLQSNDGDAVLCLGGATSPICPNGAEYEGCPDRLTLEHEAYGAPDQLAGPGSAVRTDITLVPCSEDFETQTPATATIAFSAVNEFEQVLSTSTTITCWDDLSLASIGAALTAPALGTDFAQTRMVASPNGAGVIAVAQEFHDATSLTASAAFNLHTAGTRAGGDVITLPTGP
jgi:hypothetical protein